MKKFLSCAIAAMLVLSMAACGSSSGSNAQKASNVSKSNSESEEIQQSDVTKDSETVISEAVLLDESGVKITAKSLDNELFGPAIKLLVENDSGKNLTFQCQNASVNGYMVDTMMSVDVASGKKANDELIFMSSDLEACGISTIADMEFSFHIFTTEDWETYLDSMPIQMKTSAADTYEYVFDDSGALAYDGNGVKIIVKGLVEDDSILDQVLLFILKIAVTRILQFRHRMYL